MRARFTLCSVVLVASLTLVGCYRTTDPCGEPIYLGDATDEAWLSLLDGEPRTQIGGMGTVTIESPEEGAQLPSNPAPVFKWSSPIAARMPGPFQPAAKRPLSFWASLSELLLPNAWAHLPPVTGDIYALRFQVPGAQKPLCVLTTELQWQPDEAALQTLKSGNEAAISLSITSAYLTQNRITEGPYRPAAPRTFRLVP